MNQTETTVTIVAAIVARLITDYQLSYAQMKKALREAVKAVDNQPVRYEIL